MPSKDNKDLTTYYMPVVKYAYNFPRVKDNLIETNYTTSYAF
jgi:hypothetical protein